MPIPNPEPGLVISYAYLWHREHEAGREEGRKDRPSVIVLAIEREADMPQSSRCSRSPIVRRLIKTRRSKSLYPSNAISDSTTSARRLSSPKATNFCGPAMI